MLLFEKKYKLVLNTILPTGKFQTYVKNVINFTSLIFKKIDW